MKRIEQLAKEYVRSDEAWIDDGYTPAEQTYEAGFRRARDLMYQKITEKIGHAGLSTIGCDEKMGEEEV